MSMEDFPKRLPHKLRQIRERTGLTPHEFAQQVSAQDGTDIAASCAFFNLNVNCSADGNMMRIDALTWIHGALR